METFWSSRVLIFETRSGDEIYFTSHSFTSTLNSQLDHCQLHSFAHCQLQVIKRLDAIVHSSHCPLVCLRHYLLLLALSVGNITQTWYQLRQQQQQNIHQIHCNVVWGRDEHAVRSSLSLVSCIHFGKGSGWRWYSFYRSLWTRHWHRWTQSEEYHLVVAHCTITIGNHTTTIFMQWSTAESLPGGCNTTYGRRMQSMIVAACYLQAYHLTSLYLIKTHSFLRLQYLLVYCEGLY